MGTLTKRQSNFILYYVESRNTVQSAVDAGYSKSYAKSRSHELLQNPLIKEQITHLSKTFYENQFQELSIAGVKKLSAILSDDEDRPTQLRAIKMIFQLARISDRHGEPEKVETETVFKLTFPKDMRQFMPDD